MALRCCLWMLLLASLNPQQRQLNLESFDKVWSTIRDQHWDPKLGGLDWAAVRDELRPKMEQADTMPKARAVLEEMVGRLHQTHFSIVPAEVYKDLDGKNRSDADDGWAGLDVRVSSGKALVVSAEKGSVARPGWEILRIDGADLAPVLEKIDQAYKNSTLREILLARAVTSRLAGKVGSTAKVAFLDGENHPIELEIPRVQQRGVKTRFGFLPARYVWFESKKLDGNTGYVAFNIFLNPASLMPAFEDAVRSCARCDGLILDLRGNPGGIGGMAMGMAGWFLDGPEKKLGTMYTRQSPLQFAVNPRLETYRGRLAILVDGNSGSTSEVFAGGMKDLGRARIFGTRTAGAALPSVFERLPNGDGFQYAIANYISEGGKPLEGIGVFPDVEVPLSRDALLQGRDPAVEAAVDWIRKKKEEAP